MSYTPLPTTPAIPVVVVNSQIDFPLGVDIGTPTVEATPNRFTIADHSQYISTISSKVLNANPARSFLFIQNSSKFKIWIDFNQNASQGFPSMQLNSNQILFMESTSITTDSIYAIGEVDNLPLTIKEG